MILEENLDDYHTINFGACNDQPARKDHCALCSRERFGTFEVESLFVTCVCNRDSQIVRHDKVSVGR